MNAERKKAEGRVPVVYTDDAKACQGIPNPHEIVKHSVSE